jgi:hypothetical protein
MGSPAEPGLMILAVTDLFAMCVQCGASLLQ